MLDPNENRRKHVRIYRNFVLLYHIKGESSTHEMSQVNNISRGGISFSSGTAIPKDTALVIEIRTPFLTDKVEFEGVVLESQVKIANLIFTNRVQFVNLTPKAKEILEKIEHYSSQQG